MDILICCNNLCKLQSSFCFLTSKTNFLPQRDADITLHCSVQEFYSNMSSVIGCFHIKCSNIFPGNADSSISHVYDKEMVWIGSVTGLMMP